MIVAGSSNDGLLGRQQGADTLPLRLRESAVRAGYAPGEAWLWRRECGQLPPATGDMAPLRTCLVRTPPAGPAEAEGLLGRVLV